MPKVQHSPIRMYFLIQANESNGNKTRESECKACGLRMKGSHASNMERHVRRSHPGIYEKYLEIKQKFFNPVTRNYEQLDDQVFNELNLLNFDPGNFMKKIKCKPEGKGKQLRPSTSQPIFSIENMIDSCIELVTINGRSFSLMNDSGFRSLIKPMLSRMDPSLEINEMSIKNFVLEKAAKLKSLIAENVKNKILCLKLDCLTYCTRSFLGIHVQYYEENSIKLFTLGTIEISVKTDTTELSCILWDTLNQFNIKKHQIYCVVIDNGSNFATLLEIEEADEESSFTKPSDSADADNSVKIDFSFSEKASCNVKSELCIPDEEKSVTDIRSSNPEASEAEVQVITIYDEFDDDDLDSNTTDMIFKKLHTYFFEETKTVDEQFNLCEMQCAAYTLQASVNDALKTSEINDTIKEAKIILKKLNSPQFQETLKQLNVNIPTSDFPVRWKSVFTTMEKLLELKSICVNLSLTSDDCKFWQDLKYFLLCLKSCKLVSHVLQTEQFTLCDVYKIWFNSILEISKLDYTNAEVLVYQMRQKQETLFENISFLSAVFLDPRFNKMVLNKKQKEEAISHLTILYEKFFNENLSSDQNQANENDANYQGEEDELEKIFREQENYNRQRTDETGKLKEIEWALRNFCDNEPRLKTTENIFNFWEKKKVVYPKIYNLVCIILSVPATQKSINSLIPQIRYVLKNDKEKIDSNLLNDVLLIRSNPIL